MTPASRQWLVALVVATSLAAPAPAPAETLRESLTKAYLNNPTLTGARAAQRAIDEAVPAARSQGLPQVSTNASYSEFPRRSANSFTAPERVISVGPSVTLPLFRGGAVRNSVRSAEALVEAGQANLRSVEASVFTRTVAAYMDVIRQEAIVELSLRNVQVLEVYVRSSTDQFTAGELTRTDVAQSEGRLSAARGELQAARAELDASREAYLQVVGTFPAELEPPPPLPPLPSSASEALEQAVASNPSIAAAQAESRSARHEVGVARASRLPTLSAFAAGEYLNYLDTLGGAGNAAFAQRETTGTLGLRASIPIYQGGLPGVRVREAQARFAQALERVTEVERAVVADTRSAYSRYVASLEVIRSVEAAVAANELALEGVRIEQSVGTRTVLDVLNAEQELLNRRIALVSARRDAYVQGFNVLAAIGRAEADDLGLDSDLLYDPEVNYRRVRGRFNDWDEDAMPEPVATSTVGVPAASAVRNPPTGLPASAGSEALTAPR